MIIVPRSIPDEIYEYAKTGEGNYSQSLSFIWTLKQYQSIQTKSNNKYKIGFLVRLYSNTTKWITTDPARSIIRLRKLNRCSYCDRELFDKNGDGDHIVGKGLDGALWQVPCCHTITGNCNSSKGKKDLLDWWQKKNKDIDELKIDVLSIYLRAKWKLLSRNNLLYTKASDSQHYFIKQLWSKTNDAAI